MWSLPTFLTFPFTLPSLPSISLPANIQRRFLSYVLKRTLGRFIKAGFDVERIQTQIGDGRVEIDGLQLDEDEVNRLIPSSVPLRLSSGTLARVSAQLPFPNLWSGSLSVDLDTLYLDFDLVSPTSAPVQQPQPSVSRPKFPESPSLDLASSVTTAADEFLHEELDAYEEAELDRSIRQSLVLSVNDPFSNNEVPGAFPTAAINDAASPQGDPMPASVESTTVLAGLVERILERLQVSVQIIRVRVRHDDPKFGGAFNFCIDSIRYGAEDPSSPGEVVRSITISGVNLCAAPASERASSPISARSRSTSSSSTSTSSDYEDADMMMSQAVADLRQSVAASAISGKSVYMSAYGDDDLGNPNIHDPVTVSPQRSVFTDRSSTPTPALAPPVCKSTLLSLGNENIVCVIRTRRASSTAGTSDSSPVEGSQPTVSLHLSLGRLATLFRPKDVATILSIMQLATPPPQAGPRASSEAKPIPTRPQPKLEAAMTMKGINVAVLYDLESDRDPDFEHAIQEYWSKPSTCELRYGHLKLQLESINARYTRMASGHGRPTRQGSDRRKSASRGASSTASLTIAEMSIYEHIAMITTVRAFGDNSPPGGTFPVLIFDPNLPRQYLTAPGIVTPMTDEAASHPTVASRSPFPDFANADWRGAPGNNSDKAWRVRPKSAGILKGSLGGSKSPQNVISVGHEVGLGTSVWLQPVHLFGDLSLVERLLPFLRQVSPAMKPPPTDAPGRSPLLTPRRLPREELPPRKTYSIIEDFERISVPVPPEEPPTAMVAVCPFIRIDIRCPAPPNRRGGWGDGSYLRSGVVTIDVHDISFRSSSVRPSQPPTRGILSTPHTPGSLLRAEWQKMLVFFTRVPEKKAFAILVVGPLGPDSTDLPNEPPLAPTIEIESQSQTSRFDATNSKTVVCRIPSVQARIRQPTVEGLQFFADDVTHWLDGAFGDGSAPRPRDDLKMIGSRFFGSKGSSSVSSSTEDEVENPSATTLRVIVSEAHLLLLVPRSKSESSLPERQLALRASDIDTRLEQNLTGRQESAISITITDADFIDESYEVPRTIFGRTTPFSLTAHNRPILQMRFSSVTHPETGTKETGIKLTCCHWTMFVTKELEWIHELKAFAKTPEGVFEDVVPAEVTRIQVSLDDCSIHIKAPTLPGAIVTVLGQVNVNAEIVSEADENTVALDAASISLLAIDDAAMVAPLRRWSSMSAEVWRKAGLAPMLDMPIFAIRVTRDVTGSGELDIQVLQSQVAVTACADSAVTLGSLAGDLGNLTGPKPPSAPRRQVSLEKSINVFDSIDEDAFALNLPEIVAQEPDMITDDLPTNLNYLDRASRQSFHGVQVDRSTGESLRTWQTEGDDFLTIPSSNSDFHQETIKILYDGELDMPPDYWDSMPIVNASYADNMPLGKTRVRIQNCDLSVYLHDGYDWVKTRKVIEDEIKVVRRRLEKIRQLLASGQTADASIERTSSVLFNSVYIGLESSSSQPPTGEADTAALIAAIDEELQDLKDATETATQTSWQTFPTAGPRPTKTKTRLRGKRLTRSKLPKIEISVRGIKADVDVYDAGEPTASRVHVAVAAMDIIDRLHSSTWKKFLTEMSIDSRGNVRETGADMIRVELVAVRPSLQVPEETETRLRLKVLPLRLHVDQDALDFLKKFGAFKPPQEGPVTPKPASEESFLQSVEIFPIELKLDYKPKRVDFAALREGKTSELMNFFHFDGAEMTLRHLTLSGIAGWTRLSETVQDIWTPDVKANQLADVISGVSPIRSIVNVGSGVADLILLPIEQYRKDGRIARGVQRGANSFVRSTGMEMMKLGAKMATGTQVILERAEGALSGRVVGEFTPPNNGTGSSGRYRDPDDLESSSEDEFDMPSKETTAVSRYANQPTDIREGVQAAYQSLSKNFNSAAQTILAVPMEVYERSGDDGPLRAVVRAVPIAMLKPMIGASEAVSKTLLGMRNHLDPGAKREIGDKYK